MIPQMLVAASRAYSEHAFASREGGGTCMYADYAFGLSLQPEALRHEVCGRYVNRTRVSHQQNTISLGNYFLYFYYLVILFHLDFGYVGL